MITELDDPKMVQEEFRKLAVLDPRLLVLERQANAYAKKTPPNKRQNAFYNVFKDDVVYLAGWERKLGVKELRTSEAYDVVYIHILNTMTKKRKKVEGEKRWR